MRIKARTFLIFEMLANEKGQANYDLTLAHTEDARASVKTPTQRGTSNSRK